MDLGLFAMLGGIVGARVFHFVQYNEDYDSWTQFFQIWKGGIVFYGGLIGGFICCTIYILKHKLNYWVVSEVCGPVIPIGIAFARLGCFLNGCCFGKTCAAESFAAVRFPAYPLTEPLQSSPAFKHQGDVLRDQIGGVDNQIVGLREQIAELVPSQGTEASAELTAQIQGIQERIGGLEGQGVVLDEQLRTLANSGFSEWIWPSQLFSSLGAMVIFGLLMVWSRFFARKPGESFFMLLVLYAPFRFWMETFRDDSPASWWGGMTAGQAVGVPLLVIGLVGMAWLRFGNPRHMNDVVMVDGVAVGTELNTHEGPRSDAPVGLRPLQEGDGSNPDSPPSTDEPKPETRPDTPAE